MRERKRISGNTLAGIFMVSMRLGFTSFGGPIAHLGYFHEEYVKRRKWLDEKGYAELVALCQFLPGPASSQVGIGIGIVRGGLLGGIISFIGFTLPSVIALILLALLLNGMDVGEAGWIHGLKLVAVAVVAHAIIGMAEKLTPDLKRKAIALVAMVITLIWELTFTQVAVIGLGALAGYMLFKQEREEDESPFDIPISRKLAAACLLAFFGLLFLLPFLREMTSVEWIAVFDSFYRSGALVFGGGHVVLPLLEQEVVPSGWVSEEAFLAGYGAAQAVPGPLFTFAAYLGAVMNGWAGGLLATAAIFLPAFLLIVGTLPFWASIRQNPAMNGAFMGVNAAVVGILIAAFYQPIWTSTIKDAVDFAAAAVLFSMLAYWKLPPWSVVAAGAMFGVGLDVLNN